METGGRQCIRILFSAALLIGLTWHPAHSQAQKTGLKKIGVLETFSGGVTLKNKGFWGVSPRSGLTIHHGDKILTDSDGACRVVFHDGAVLDVRPNSSIRLAEIKQYDGSFLRQERHLRLFVGKLRYKSGTDSRVRAKLVSPTAAAVLKGSEAEFGTDGILAMLNQLEGDSALAGDVAETDRVPDATADLAKDNPDYKASKAADQVRRQYNNAVKVLLQSALDADTGRMLAAGATSPLLMMQLLAQTPPSGPDRASADRVLILAALYVLADANALKVENEQLLNHPDPGHRQRAQQALKDAATTIETARESLTAARETVQKIRTLIETALSGDAQGREAALAEAKPVIQEMMQQQREVIRQARGASLGTNVMTAGVDADQQEMPEYDPPPEIPEVDVDAFLQNLIDEIETGGIDAFIREIQQVDEDLYEQQEAFQEDKEEERRKQEIKRERERGYGQG